MGIIRLIMTQSLILTELVGVLLKYATTSYPAHAAAKRCDHEDIKQLILKSQRLEMECEVVILVKKSNIKSFETTFEAFHKIKVEILND